MSGTCSCHDKSPSVVLSNGFIGFSRFKLFCPISVNGKMFLMAHGQEFPLWYSKPLLGQFLGSQKVAEVS
jgi:hypothetical protein